MTREDIIRIADEQRWKTATTILVIGTIDELQARIAELEAAVLAEREACAKLADEIGGRDEFNHAWDVMDAIRARGEK